MLIEYDHASGLTPTQRMDSLVASVQRALEELAETAGSGKGEKGDKGDIGPAGPQGPKGDPGPKGERGDSGITMPISGFFTMSVDEEGYLYVHVADGGEKPPFRYDEGEGILYYDL